MKPEQLNFQPSEEVIGKNQPGVAVDEPTVRKIVKEVIEEVIKQEKNNILDEAKAEIEKKIQASQASFITVFGIFASITSFLTIEFQFLKTLNNILQILGFTLVLFALLFGFNIGLDYLVKSRIDKEFPLPNLWFSGFVMILLFIGIFLTCIGSTLNPTNLVFL